MANPSNVVELRPDFASLPLMGARGGAQPNDGRQSHHTGMVGEGRFIVFASTQGWHIYRGVSGHTPCDFVVDDGQRLLRVEVKRAETVQRTHNNYYYCLMSGIRKDAFDFIFVSTPQADYWIPSEACPSTLSIKQHAEDLAYTRTINRPGKYEVYRCG